MTVFWLLLVISLSSLHFAVNGATLKIFIVADSEDKTPNTGTVSDSATDSGGTTSNYTTTSNSDDGNLYPSHSDSKYDQDIWYGDTGPFVGLAREAPPIVVGAD